MSINEKPNDKREKKEEAPTAIITDRTRESRKHVNTPPKQRDTGSRTNWGLETARAGAVIGRFFLRILSWVLNVVITIALIGMITGTIVGGIFALWIKNYVDPTIDATILTTDQDLTTRIYYLDYTNDPNGEAVEIEDQRLYSTENRLWASYSEIPDQLIECFVAVEDKRFWTHNGVDWITTVKATFGYFLGTSTAGGSTITQQLVKNLTHDDEVTIQRKVQEIFRALNLEKQKSKEEILELYLNTINLGQGCYGVKAAAKKYFGKELSELTLTECAAIAAIPKSPTYYNPYSNPDNNEYRRNQQVLYAMLEQGMITQSEYDSAAQNKLVLNMQDDTVLQNTTNSWYTDAVIEDVIADLQETYDISRITASTMIYSEGLSIYTCMDPFVQDTLESVFENDSYFPTVSSAVEPECAMVILNPTNGNILGLVGGRGEKTTSRSYNIATMSKRSPGSSIKPLTVYAPALEAGVITYGTVIDDTPFTFNEDESNGTTTYTAYPANLPAVYNGLTTINSAVERSVNTVAIKVLDKLGLTNSFNFSQKIGMYDIVESYEQVDGSTLSDISYAPLALGALTVGVTPREMAQAYTFLANDGIYSEARTYYKVLDKNGEVLLDNEQKSSVVVSEQTASIMTQILCNVVKNGTAKAITLQNSVDVAGKTGTATSDYDRWFCGYTPYYLGACWFGYTEPRTIGSISTISPATYIWDVVMTKLHEPLIKEAESTGTALKKFELASGVVTATYCKDSGKLITDACVADLRGSRAETGYFTMETVPTEACDCHVLVPYDTVTGAVATADCPEDQVKEVGLITVTDRDFPTEVYVTDAQYVYREWTEEDGITTNHLQPFFQSLVQTGRYIGISYTTTGVQANSYCYEHYIDHSNDPVETETEEVGTDTEETDGKSA